MKQSIDVNQLKQLSEEQLKKLHEYNKKNSFLSRIVYKEIYKREADDFCYANATMQLKIGDMIEILTNHHPKYKETFILEIYQSTRIKRENKTCNIYESFGKMEGSISDHCNRELCDVLWEAIVEIL